MTANSADSAVPRHEAGTRRWEDLHTAALLHDATDALTQLATDALTQLATDALTRLASHPTPP